RAQCSGAASFGYFSSLLKKSDPLARRASGSLCSQPTKAKSLDPRQEHAGMTSEGKSWMTSPVAIESPACAGMTNKA
ncbi:MAG: hypothetical protein IJI03_21935, partial [Rudaea sp.]|nr:hypothetical protein [Rudaea sp.]